MLKSLLRPSGLMTEGSIPKQMLIFAIPLLLSNLLQQLYNIVDSAIVGNFVGSEALAAVGTVGSVTSLIVGFFLGFSTGGSVVISQFYGAGAVKDVHESVHTAIALSLCGGVLLMIVGYFITPPALQILAVPPDVEPLSRTYLRIYFYGTVPILVYNMGSGILRAVGNSTAPLCYLAVGAVTNVAMDLLFVAVFKWGVAGAAWATLISQTVSAVLVMANLMTTGEIYRVYPSKIRFKGDKLLKILKVGVPAGLQTSVISVSNVIIQRNINAFGKYVMAGCAVGGRIDGLVSMPIGAIGLAATGFSGQNTGAGKIDRVRKGAGWAVLLSVGITVVLGGILLLFNSRIAALFDPDPQVVEAAVQMMWYLLPLYWLFAVVDSLCGVIRGAGSPIAPVVIVLAGMCVFRIVWLAITVPMYTSVQTVLLTYPVSWALTAAATLIMFFFGGWRKKAERIAKKYEQEG